MAAWFRREKKPLKKSADRGGVPSDVFDKCPGCGEILYTEHLTKNLGVCPDCGHHTRIAAARYVELLLDSGSFEEMDAQMRSGDPLGFSDLKPYPARLRAAEAKLGRSNGVVSGSGRIEGRTVALAVMDFAFIGGSMGSVVGEKIARAGRYALQYECPFLVVCASGGARMQEGIMSLMQMAKTSAVLARLHEASLPYIAILTHPTTGGVTASFAMLGDINLAEPGALIGFAGPRVIEETINQKLPEGFQRSEFLLEHGMVDRVVDRRVLRKEIAALLAHMADESVRLPSENPAETSAATASSAPAPPGSNGRTTTPPPAPDAPTSASPKT